MAGRIAYSTFALALGLLALSPASSHANPVAAACADLSGRKDIPGLWLGHFTGGNVHRRRDQLKVEWRDEYRCFTSASACSRWRADMGRIWLDVRGHGTCLALRNGGRRYAPAISVRY